MARQGRVWVPPERPWIRLESSFLQSLCGLLTPSRLNPGQRSQDSHEWFRNHIFPLSPKCTGVLPLAVVQIEKDSYKCRIFDLPSEAH
jgi:hypothetical protein